MSKKETIYRTYKFRAYLPLAVQILANAMMARVVKPIWNAAQSERAANHKEYAAQLDAAFSDFVQGHRRDMTAKEEAKIRRAREEQLLSIVVHRNPMLARFAWAREEQH